jgi:hypothetical protein
MVQTRKKRGLKNRGSRKKLFMKSRIQGGMAAAPPKPIRDTKYATTMVKNIAPPKSTPTSSYAGVCNEISNQTNKLGSVKITSSSIKK